EADVQDLTVTLPDYPVKNRGPLHLSLADGGLQVRQLALSGEGTDLAVGGSANLLGDGALALTVRGAADLRALSLVSSELRGRGAWRSRLRARAPRRWWRARWTSRVPECACADSPTAWRRCGAACCSTVRAPISRGSRARWGAGRWSWRARPPTRPGSSPRST